MRPIQAITTCLRKAFQFSGTASRSEFWWFLPVGLGLAVSSVHLASIMWLIKPEILGPSALFIVMMLPVWAVAVRRLHDVAKSGCWVGTPLALNICALPLIYFFVQFADAVCGNDPNCFVMVAPNTLRGIMFWIGELAVIFVAVITPFIIFCILCMCSRPASPGPNSYGPNPLEVTP